MPRSSSASLTPETVSQLENQFFNFLNGLSYDEKKLFFNEFLTSEEKMMMYKRLALYYFLLQGMPLSKIQQLIGVTHDTTRVYNKKKNMLSEEFKSLMGRVENTLQAEENQPPQQMQQQGMEEQGQHEGFQPQQDDQMHQEQGQTSESGWNDQPQEHMEPTPEPMHQQTQEQSWQQEQQTMSDQEEHKDEAPLEKPEAYKPHEDFHIETREPHDYEDRHEQPMHQVEQPSEGMQSMDQSQHQDMAPIQPDQPENQPSEQSGSQEQMQSGSEEKKEDEEGKKKGGFFSKIFGS